MEGQRGLGQGSGAEQREGWVLHSVSRAASRAGADRDEGRGRGRQGFYKGIALAEKASAFGAEAGAVQRLREEEARRADERARARADAESAARMAAGEASSAAAGEDSSAAAGEEAAKRSQDV